MNDTCESCGQVLTDDDDLLCYDCQLEHDQEYDAWISTLSAIRRREDIDFDSD